MRNICRDLCRGGYTLFSGDYSQYHQDDDPLTAKEKLIGGAIIVGIVAMAIYIILKG